MVFTNASSGGATGQIGSNSTSKPPGYVGITARGYRASNGALICQSATTYNSTTIPAGAYFNHTCTLGLPGNGAYYSKGLAHYYNGSYVTYTQNTSPNQNIPG